MKKNFYLKNCAKSGLDPDPDLDPGHKLSKVGIGAGTKQFWFHNTGTVGVIFYLEIEEIFVELRVQGVQVIEIHIHQGLSQQLTETIKVQTIDNKGSS